MLVIVFGSIMLSILLHLLNIESPIVVSVSDRVTLVRLLQFSKALVPMLVIVFGSTMLSILLQFWNADAPIFVPPVRITSFKLLGT